MEPPTELQMNNNKSSLKRELGLTGDIELDIERFGKNGRKISEQHKRSKSLETIQHIIMDIIVPACDNVTDILMVIGLYNIPSFRVFSFWTIGLLYLPTFFLVIHFILNFRERSRWWAELIFLILFGPAIDWMTYLVRFIKKNQKNIQEPPDPNVDKFLFIAKIVNGVIEASLQLIWTVLLISIQVKPLPWTDLTHIPDLVGNTVPIPVSTLSIVFSVISIIKSLAYFWNNYGVARHDGSIPTDIKGGFLVLPILFTSLIFRLGCLIMFSVYLNIYTIAVLGLSLVVFNIIRLFRICYEESSALGEAVSSFANSILPTPSSTDPRSHNLYLIHDLITSSIYLSFLIVIQVLNLDYNNPTYKRLDNLVIGHKEFLLIIGVIIFIVLVNCFSRFLFSFLNWKSGHTLENKESKRVSQLKIKINKVVIVKVLSILFLGLLMATSVALLVVSAVISSDPVVKTVDYSDDISSKCLVKFQYGDEFLLVNSITCNSVANIEFSQPKNILNDTLCYSSISNYNVEDYQSAPRSMPGVYEEYGTDYSDDSDEDYFVEPLDENLITVLPLGFGLVENIIFIVVMFFIIISLLIIIFWCKRRKRPTKSTTQMPKKPSAKRPVCRENANERTL